MLKEQISPEICAVCGSSLHSVHYRAEPEAPADGVGNPGVAWPKWVLSAPTEGVKGSVGPRY